MAIFADYELSPFDESDPDDFRPNSSWALLVDATDGSATHVDDITVVIEEIAPGDSIPLHTHPINEVTRRTGTGRHVTSGSSPATGLSR